MIGNLVHPFRNVLFGVGIFVGFWWFFWLVFKFFFFYSVRLKTINPSLTIYAMLQTELPDQDSIVFNQKEKGRAYRTPLLLTQLIPLCLGQFFFPLWLPNTCWEQIHQLWHLGLQWGEDLLQLRPDSHFPQAVSSQTPTLPWFPQELPSLSLSALNLLPDRSSNSRGLSWDRDILSWAEQNVLRWAFPFGCPADPIHFAFGEVLCKGCKSNLRLLGLFFCVLSERESIDLCKQRGNELRGAPLTTLPLLPAGYHPRHLRLHLLNCLCLGVLRFNLKTGK